MSGAASEQLEMALPDEAATIRLAEDIAALVEAGDIIALTSELGAGKSTFARAAIRALAGDPDLDVPSPTFALRLDYSLPRVSAVHCDLYRVGDLSELDEIGLDEAIQSAALFVEWPDDALRLLGPDRLTIDLKLNGETRSATISPEGTWRQRLKRTEMIRRFIEDAGFPCGHRTPIAGDASGRAYERIEHDSHGSGSAILMKSLVELSDHAAREKAVYDAVVHRSDDPAVFVAIAKALGGLGIGAPRIMATNFDLGLILMEDFGSEGLVCDDMAIPERFSAAMETLARLHEQDCPPRIPMPGGAAYTIPTYDHGALLAEVEVFFDWVMADGLRPDQLDPSKDDFRTAWAGLLDTLSKTDQFWVLRDYHSPNIFWRAEKGAEGAVKADPIAVIDFQDMVLGPSAYDCVSLGQDARVCVSPQLEKDLMKTYFQARRMPEDRQTEFRRDYAILGAQRASKILGAFRRFAIRDGNPAYIRHMGRVKDYLSRNLAHPGLAPVRRFYDQHI